MTDEDPDPVLPALLGVVAPPESSASPLTDVDTAVRAAAKEVDETLAWLRASRDNINVQVRELVVEQERLRRLLRVLDAK
jgi:hypothetical protein